MVKTVFIGQGFLYQRSSKDEYNLYYFFYGANRINANIWQVNLSKGSSGTNMCISTPFCLNLEIGRSLRFFRTAMFMQRDGSVDVFSDSGMDLAKSLCLVSCIRIVDIGHDFLTIEYELAK